MTVNVFDGPGSPAFAEGHDRRVFSRCQSPQTLQASWITSKPSIWAALAPDRIFGYADAALVDQVRLAAQQGEFDTQPAIDLTLHGDATSSFKQNQFGEANLQLTFHEKNRKRIAGVDCVYVEPDIDYFQDNGAHLILEVIPNGLTGNVSNPRVVYVLRWIAGRRAGVPDFDPLIRSSELYATKARDAFLRLWQERGCSAILSPGESG